MSSYGELPLPLQIFIPCFGVLFVIALIASVFQMCHHPYGHYGHHGMGMGMMMGAGGMGMGGPMIAPSVSMTCEYIYFSISTKNQIIRIIKTDFKKIENL